MFGLLFTFSFVFRRDYVNDLVLVFFFIHHDHRVDLSDVMFNMRTPRPSSEGQASFWTLAATFLFLSTLVQALHPWISARDS